MTEARAILPCIVCGLTCAIIAPVLYRDCVPVKAIQCKGAPLINLPTQPKFPDGSETGGGGSVCLSMQRTLLADSYNTLELV